MSLTRRTFLKTGVAAACAACASQTPMSASAAQTNVRELATLIDIRKCIGCEACVEACRDVNESKYPDPKKPYPKM